MNDNTFIREISETQSKYKLVRKNVNQQSSYNLSVEYEDYMKKNNIIKIINIPGKENDGNIYYTVNNDVTVKLGPGITNLIGNSYNNINVNLILVHTTNNNKFQIRRNDHNTNDVRLNWYKELYDKNFEGANFILKYDPENKILYIDNKFDPSRIVSDVNDNLEVNDYIELYKNYYITNLDKIKLQEKKGIELRNKFVIEYPIERLKTLSVDEYVLGTDNSKNTLSYRLEFGDYKYAGPGIGGSTAAKFGVYMNNSSKEYICGKTTIENIESFWEQFINQLYLFIKEYENVEEQFNATEKYPLLKGMSMVLTKLLYMYYPEKFINICSKKNLELLMKCFDYKYSKDMQADELSYLLNKNIRENINLINENDPAYIGSSLWNFIKDIVDSSTDEEQDLEESTTLDEYSKDEFLKEVFMNEKEYNTIYNLLIRKKNLILQGSPGVGKTFMARRLAYSIMNIKDESKILSVQFHQNFSYEDFVEGIRPNSNGDFVYESGIFKNFVEKASKDKNHKYFCIIDEINRGNLSKILGELMKLIEYDKRDKENSILPYSKTIFTIPENVYIIGTMNTADRSLAMVDYALRRRFAFYFVEPAFSKIEFKNYLINNNKLTEEQVSFISNKLTNLNNLIKNDLGKGFEIGHSYFVNTLNKNDFQNLYSEIINFEIKPLLEEYWFDDEDKVDEYKEML